MLYITLWKISQDAQWREELYARAIELNLFGEYTAGAGVGGFSRGGQVEGLLRKGNGRILC